MCKIILLKLQKIVERKKIKINEKTSVHGAEDLILLKWNTPPNTPDSMPSPSESQLTLWKLTS